MDGSPYTDYGVGEDNMTSCRVNVGTWVHLGPVSTEPDGTT